MEKLSYIKPHTEVVALNNQSAILAGSTPGMSGNGADPGTSTLISKRRYTGAVEIDPASWDYTLWSERSEMIDDVE